VTTIRTLSLPQPGGWVIEANLNCSESRRRGRPASHVISPWFHSPAWKRCSQYARQIHSRALDLISVPADRPA